VKLDVVAVPSKTTDFQVSSDIMGNSTIQLVEQEEGVVTLGDVGRMVVRLGNDDVEPAVLVSAF
jgi:hypothetical protein